MTKLLIYCKDLRQLSTETSGNGIMKLTYFATATVDIILRKQSNISMHIL